MADIVQHTPGPWRVGHRFIDVGCENAKIGGYAKLFDVRGWGYLAGQGHGALSHDPSTAYAIQQANARLIAAAPDMLEALKAAEELYRFGLLNTPLSQIEAVAEKRRAAIAKAEGRA